MDIPPPPGGSRLLLRWILPAEIRDEVLGEMEERFEERVVRGETIQAARRWYRGQARRSVIPGVRARMGGAFRRSVDRTPSGSRQPLESVLQDVVFALGQLRRSPGFTLVVILTLALGVGATTAVFSLVDAALLKPFPYRDAESLVVIRGDRTLAETNSPFMSGPDLMDIRREARALSGVAAFGEPLVGPLTQVDHPAQVKMILTSADFFQVLGVRAVVGHVYTPEVLTAATADETAFGSAVLSFGLWQRAFGGDPEVVGRTIRVWGTPLVVSGVLPEDFHLRMPLDLNAAGDLDLYQTQDDDFTEEREDSWWLRVVARLDPGATLAGAAGELSSLSASIEAYRVPNKEQGMRFRVESLAQSSRAPIRATLTAFTVAVFLVLLIACANVANLLLVRGASRGPELAVRSALGAGRGRIVRQLVTECGVLSVLGAALGIGLAFAMVWGVVTLAPTGDLLHVDRTSPDLRVLAFGAIMAVTTTLLAGLVPALRVTGGSLSGGFGHRGGVGGQQRFAGSLAITQIALSVTLLAGVGLMVRTVSELRSVPLGFEPSGVLTATVAQPLRPDEERAATEEALLRETSALPGVQAAGIVFPLPMNGVYERAVRFADHRLENDPARWRDGYFRTVSPGYLNAMGIELRSGRGFTDEDDTGERPVVIVDEELARRTWPAENPLGKMLRVVGMGADSDSLYFEVVGVAEYAPQWDHRDVQSTLYFPRTFYRSHEVSIALKVAGDPLLLAGPLREAIRRVEAELPAEVMPLERFVSEALGPTRFVLILLGAFAGIAIGLSGVGLYGVLAFGVRQRTREFGVRLAMGAEKGTLLAEVARQGGRISFLGAVLGLGGALVLGLLLRSHLFQVGLMDPLALAGTAGVILLVAALASWIPARNAASVDPVEALRAE